MTDLPIKIRPAEPGDRGLIVTSWLRSYQPFTPWLPKEEFYRYYREFIHKLLSKEGVECHVACNPNMQDHVFGWICVRPGNRPLCHYIFIKSNYRKLGIGTCLLRECLDLDTFDDFSNTHWTTDAKNASMICNYRPDLIDIKEENDESNSGTTGSLVST